MKNVLLMLLAMSLLVMSCTKEEDDVANCNDGIRNQDETAIDCGGVVCTACASCSDGILNQGETRTDCGGPCAACSNCVTCTSSVVGSNPITYCENDFLTQQDYNDAVANAQSTGRTCN